MDSREHREQGSKHEEDAGPVQRGIVVTACDDNPLYLEQLEVMLKSIRENSNGTRVVVNLVGCSDSVTKRIRGMYHHADVKNHPDPKVEDRRGYMVCFRSSCLLDAISSVSIPVAWMDTDVIVRSSLTPMWEWLTPNSLKIRLRPLNPEKSRFQAGVFAVGSSSFTKAMIKDWEKKVRKVNEWYADQLWLYKTWRKHSEVELIDMPTSLNNVGDSNKARPFLDDSIIWHCKGAHFWHPDFQKEYERYREMV